MVLGVERERARDAAAGSLRDGLAELGNPQFLEHKGVLVAKLPVAAHHALVDVRTPSFEVRDERVGSVLHALGPLLLRIDERHVAAAQRRGGEGGVRHALQHDDLDAFLRRRVRRRTARAAGAHHHDVGLLVPCQGIPGRTGLRRPLPVGSGLRRAAEQRGPHSRSPHGRRPQNEIPSRPLHLVPPCSKMPSPKAASAPPRGQRRRLAGIKVRGRWGRNGRKPFTPKRVNGC